MITADKAREMTPGDKFFDSRISDLIDKAIKYAAIEGKRYVHINTERFYKMLDLGIMDHFLEEDLKKRTIGILKESGFDVKEFTPVNNPPGAIPDRDIFAGW